MKQLRIRDRNINYIDKPANYEYSFEIAKVNNKRKKISKCGFKTKEDAYKAGIKAYEEYYNTGSIFKSKEISVHDYMYYWLDNYVKLELSDSTFTNYQLIVDRYINPKIGHYYLHLITHVTLQTFINNLYKNDECNIKHLKTILAVIKGAFKYAHLIEPFINNNPAEFVKLPKLQLQDVKKKSKIIREDDIKEILNRFKNSPLQYYGILISYHTGLRLSEVYGLTWDCINFENQTITVNKIAKLLKHQPKLKKNDKFVQSTWFLGDCKTVSSYRTIKISNFLCEQLRKLQQLQIENKLNYQEFYVHNYLNKELTNSKRTVYRVISSYEQNIADENLQEVDLVMVDEDGCFKGYHCTKYVSKVVNHKLKIPFNFHMLRHTHATMLYEKGAPIKDIQDRLGHSSFQTTMNTYVSNTKISQEKTQNIIENLLQFAA